MNNHIEIDDKIRCIVLHQDANWPVNRIAYALQKPERTIRDWISKLEQGINITQVNDGRGTKPTILEEKKRRIIRAVRRKPTATSTRKLGVKYEISKSSAHQVLTEKKFNYSSTSLIIPLTQEVKDERVSYCSKMLRRKGRDIDETFFADEMGIKLSETTAKKAWSGPYKKLKIEKPAKDIKVSCWGAISKNGATSLEIYKDSLNTKRYEGIVKKHQPEMEDLYPEGVKFQHDNSSVHVAAEQNLKNTSFEIVEFPRYSPDLNPIENLWGALKHRVKCDAPRSEAGLIKSLKNNWKVLTQKENLEPYFVNLHDRFNECVQKRGINLPY